MSFFKKIFKRAPMQPDKVVFDDECIKRTLPDGNIETLLWVDLVEVGILTTDEGPVVDDVFWMLMGKDGGGCCVPSEANGMEELLDRLQELPNFDNEAVIQAMGSTSNNNFVCWKSNN